MFPLRSLWHRTRSLATGAGLWLALAGSAWAQSRKADESSGSATPWVLPYALVLFCIALGVFMVLHPSKRRERAKPEAYGQPK
jgi:hypothetical protein